MYQKQMNSNHEPACPYETGMEGPLSIPQPENMVMVEYIFVDATRLDLQGKTKILDFEPQSTEDLPKWDYNMFDNFEQIDPPGGRPEKLLYPVAMFRDPFRRGNNKLVLCEFRDEPEKPSFINTRAPCKKVMDMVKDQEPWFGIEQEYFMLDGNGRPLGWEESPDFDPFGHEGAVGKGRTVGLQRQLAEYHVKACMYAGLKVHGLIREEAPAQWEYQIGPCVGVEMADQLVVSRYILKRVAELYGVDVTFHAKPIKDALLASGAHINFSTKAMRKEGGLKHIHEAMDKLKDVPQKTVLKYYDRNGGKDNEKRLIGGYFLPSLTECKLGIADKFASIRIPPWVYRNGRGYFEDRRPAADCDPYTATAALVRACILGDLLE